MKQIWAPWRMEYIQKKHPPGCILCQKIKQTDDEANYVLHRGKHNFIIMNCYPYNPGHLMVVPYRHIPSLEDMTEAERREHIELVSRSLKTLRQLLKPGGFNVGVNIGKDAGAGIEDHVHTHIVPRWQGDTNFMPVTADIRVVPEALAETYRKLKKVF